MRPCQKCCCFGHCTFDCQCQSKEDLYGGEGIVSKFQTDVLCSLPSGWLDESIALGRLPQILSTTSKHLMDLNYFFNCYQMWIPWVYLSRYPGKYFPGESLTYRFLPFNLCCLGLVLPLMTCCLQALDPTDENSRK